MNADQPSREQPPEEFIAPAPVSSGAGAAKREGRMTHVWFSIARLCLAAVALWAMTGCESMGRAGELGQRFRDYFTGKTPLNAAKKMENQTFADERRQGIIELVDRAFGRREPYTHRYEQIAQYDTDWLVRATAIRALNRSRDTSATPIFVKALSDENPIVRTEAVKALNNMPDESAVPTLLKFVGDSQEDKDVRIWSADALRHFRRFEVARTLASQLGGRDFSVAWQAHRSLRTLTGKDLSYDESAWLQYLTGPDKPLG